MDVHAGAFAALAVGGVHGSESSSSSSSSPSDSDADVEGGDASGSGSGPEDAAENGWTWSTGAAPGATLARGATAKKKKPILMPGEKRSLKKRHMAELRAARAEVRNGWTPQDVKRELESMVAAGRREWTPPGSKGVRTADAKIIARLARCYPTSMRSRRRGVRAEETGVRPVVNLAHPYHGGAEVDAERGAFRGGDARSAAAARRRRRRRLGMGDPPRRAAAPRRSPRPSRRARSSSPIPSARQARAVPRAGARRGHGCRGLSRGGRSGPLAGAGRGGAGSTRRAPDAGAGETRAGVQQRGIVDGIGGGGVARAAAERRRTGRSGRTTTDGREDGPASSELLRRGLRRVRGAHHGFGSRLMRRMGHVEGGVGTKGRGISEPVSQSLRPKNLGLGATGAG